MTATYFVRLLLLEERTELFKWAGSRNHILEIQILSEEDGNT